MPVVWAADASAEHTSAEFLDWLMGAHDEAVVTVGKVLGMRAEEHGDVLWGVPLFPMEESGAVRRLPTAWHGHDERPVTTFAAAVVDAYFKKLRQPWPDGDEEREVLVPFGSSVSLAPDHYVSELFKCPPKSTPGRCTPISQFADFRDAVVLFGGTFRASRDFVDTPAGRTAGLLLNAHAVQALVHGPEVGEFHRLFILGLDFAIGLLIVMTFETGAPRTRGLLQRWHLVTRANSALPSILQSIAIAIVAAILSVPLFFLFGLLWVSWVGMFLTGLAWHLVAELLPRSRKETYASLP